MIFQIRGTKITVSFLFTAVITLLLVSEMRTAALISFVSAILHECGHIAAVKMNGGDISAVDFGAFGARMTLCEDISISLRSEAVVAAAGPAVNFLISSLCAAVYSLTDNRLMIIICAVNCGMAFFNLIPVSALDGGRILKNLLLLRTDPERAEKISWVISCISLFAVAFSGFFLFMKTGFNFSLIITGGYLILFCVANAVL